jgi:hypothetical protein
MIEGDWIGSGQLQPHIVKGHPRTLAQWSDACQETTR